METQMYECNLDDKTTLPELGFPFDEDGNARIIVDDAMAVNVTRHDDECRLTIATPVAAELREDVGYAQMLDLLDLALGPLLGDTPAVGRDPVSGTLVAYVSVPYVRITESEWPDIFGRFVAFARGIAEKL